MRSIAVRWRPLSSEGHSPTRRNVSRSLLGSDVLPYRVIAGSLSYYFACVDKQAWTPFATSVIKPASRPI